MGTEEINRAPAELLRNTQSTADKAEGRNKDSTATVETSALHFQYGQSYEANGKPE